MTKSSPGSAIHISPVSAMSGTVSLPGSKSITNRALILAALAEGTSVLKNTLDCDDSRYLIEALMQLGVTVRRDADDRIVVFGIDGKFPVRSGRFFVGNAGTAARFLSAALTACGGDYCVEGDARMAERPIAPLVKALSELGAEVSAPTGCPPVTIGARPIVGGRADVPGHVSSQFISALLMVAPYAQRTVAVRVTGEIVSMPYVDLTVEAMRAFGADPYVDEKQADGQLVFSVRAGRTYKGCEYRVEGDASAASYFFAAAAVTGGTLRVEGVGRESAQGDAVCADVLASMGCRVKKERDAITVTGPQPPSGFLEGIDYNCGEIPDVVPTLAVVALFARGRTRLRGVAHLRHKESDRIESVATEIRKLGGTVKELADGLEIEGTFGVDPSPLHGARIDTWQDHRIAMAFSVAALAVPEVSIDSPHVVSKSFPEFFDALRALGVEIATV